MKFIDKYIQTQITMSFSEQEMSSSEQETVPIFRSADLPFVRIPSPFASSIESSGSGLSQAVIKDDCVFKVPNTRTDVILLQPLLLSSDLLSHNLPCLHRLPKIRIIPLKFLLLHSGKRRVKKVNVGKFRKEEGLKRNQFSRHYLQRDYQQSRHLDYSNK